MSKYIDTNEIKYSDFDLSFFPAVLKNIAYKKDIDKIPAADVKPVQHAHWIVDEDGGIVMCSNPDCLAEFSDNGESIEYYWNFCPNCGAKMDEEDQKDETR